MMTRAFVSSRKAVLLVLFLVGIEVETIANEMAWMTWLPVRVQKIPVSNRFGNLQPSVLRHRILWNSYSIYVKNPTFKPAP